MTARNVLHINPTEGSTIIPLLLADLEHVIWNPCCFQFPNLLRLSVMPRVSKSKKFRGTPKVGKLPASATVSAATSDSESDLNGRTDRLPETVSLSKLRLTRAAKH